MLVSIPRAKLTDEPARLAALRRYAVLDVAPEAPFDRITGVIKSLLNVPMATVTLVDAHRQWFLSRHGLPVTETTRDTSFCTHTIGSYQPLIVQDARLDPRFCSLPGVTGAPFIVSYAGVPLTTPDGYNVGSLCAMDDTVRVFTPGQIEILKTFAPLVIGELELRRIAQTDQLTGALTRRAIIAEMDHALARFDRYHRSSALLLCDIDHFKTINDTHGHPAGDKVLRAMSAVCRSVFREGDVLGRVGGEEFAALLNESDTDDAIAAAERVRSAIQEMVVPHDPPLKITASFGIAPLWAGCASAEDWLARADTALYAAKHAGRNIALLAQPMPATIAA